MLKEVKPETEGVVDHVKAVERVLNVGPAGVVSGTSA